MEFSIKDFLSTFDQISRKLWIWSHLMKKSLMENFIFCAMLKAFLNFRMTLGSQKSRKYQENLKSRWQQHDSNPQPLSLYLNFQPFSQSSQMIELCCESFSVRYIWLYVLIMSCISYYHVRVNIVPRRLLSCHICYYHVM